MPSKKILNVESRKDFTDEALKDIKSGLNEIKNGKGETIEKVAKDFNIIL